MTRFHDIPMIAVLLVSCLAFVSVGTTAAAAPPGTVSGTVVVQNGTADGARVTVTPLTERAERLDDPVRTTVDGERFSVDVRDAPAYLVEVVHDGAVHYSVLRNRTTTAIVLNETVTATVVDAEGEPRANATVELLDETGFSIDRARTGRSGSVAFGPLQPNRSYRLRATVEGVPYLRTVSANATGPVTIRTPPPTDDRSTLAVTGGRPASHVVQVLAPQNRSGKPSVIETLTLTNTGDRPYVGTVAVVPPANTTAYAAMVGGRETDYRTTPRGVELDVTIPANASRRVGVAYDLRGRVLRKRLGHDVETFAVVFQGYDANETDHSGNLRIGRSPIQLLTNESPLSRNETVRVTLPAADATGTDVGAGGNGDVSAQSNSIPHFPALRLFGGFIAMVGGGFVAYRYL